jgi:hypothetical protein
MHEVLPHGGPVQAVELGAALLGARAAHHVADAGKARQRLVGVHPDQLLAQKLRPPAGEHQRGVHDHAVAVRVVAHRERLHPRPAHAVPPRLSTAGSSTKRGGEMRRLV